MVAVENLHKRYGEKQVLDGFSCAFPQSGIICLFGPSGCGKTTLLRMIAGLEAPDDGEVLGLQGLRISHVFQNDRLLGNLTAEKNIELVAPGGTIWLDKMGLEGEHTTRVRDMSGGMQRRVALARAMAYGGDVFLLDEPFKGLDAAVKERVMCAMREALAGRLAIFITHDWAEAQAFADAIWTVEGIPLHGIKQSKRQDSIASELVTNSDLYKLD